VIYIKNDILFDCEDYMVMRPQDIEYYEQVSKEINDDPAYYKAMAEMISEGRRDGMGFVLVRNAAAASKPKAPSVGNIPNPTL